MNIEMTSDDRLTHPTEERTRDTDLKLGFVCGAEPVNIRMTRSGDSPERFFRRDPKEHSFREGRCGVASIECMALCCHRR